MNLDYESAWYGTYKVTLDDPVPTDNSSYWPPEIYVSEAAVSRTPYSALVEIRGSTTNGRASRQPMIPTGGNLLGEQASNLDCIVSPERTIMAAADEPQSTQLVQVVELYADLLGNDLVSRIEDALEVAAVGEMRRNGSYPAGDNLVLAYSNPGLMRCLTVGWIGARRSNPTLTDFANEQGRLLLELFQANGSNTLGEYNAPTYYGMDIWALAANIAYGPANATMTTNAKYILTELWKDIADHYNPYLRNLAGPYDRAYTRDMNMHSAVLSLWWWGIFGREYGGQPPLGESDLLYDVAQGAALSLVMGTAAGFLSDGTAAALRATGRWTGSRFLNKTIRSSLDTGALRVATSWLSAGVMIGAESLAETTNRGAQFVPAIVHWASDPDKTTVPYVGFFSLYPSASTIDAAAGEGTLSISYPNTTQEGADIFTFAVSGVPPGWTLDGNQITGLEELPCLSVNVSAPGLDRLPVTASTSTLEDHYYYNVSYAVPSGFQGVPKLDLHIRYTC